MRAGNGLLAKTWQAACGEKPPTCTHSSFAGQHKTLLQAVGRTLCRRGNPVGAWAPPQVSVDVCISSDIIRFQTCLLSPTYVGDGLGHTYRALFGLGIAPRGSAA